MVGHLRLFAFPNANDCSAAIHLLSGAQQRELGPLLVPPGDTRCWDSGRTLIGEAGLRYMLGGGVYLARQVSEGWVEPAALDASPSA